MYAMFKVDYTTTSAKWSFVKNLDDSRSVAIDLFCNEMDDYQVNSNLNTPVLGHGYHAVSPDIPMQGFEGVEECYGCTKEGNKFIVVALDLSEYPKFYVIPTSDWEFGNETVVPLTIDFTR